MNKKNIILLLAAAFIFISFKKPAKKKRKGSIQVGPITGNNIYAKQNSILFDSPYPTMILYNFKGGELLTFINEDIDDYFVSFVKPGGQLVKGFIDKNDVNIK